MDNDKQYSNATVSMGIKNLFFQELTPEDLVSIKGVKSSVRSKYDSLFPEVEEILGSTHVPRPSTLVWRDVSIHITQKDGKLKRLINNGMCSKNHQNSL